MKIFIGSATESKKIADEVAGLLESIDGVVVKVWDSADIFLPSRYSLESLENILPDYDGAVFVFDKDDMIESRGKKYFVPRDNVLLEMGMFAGKIGVHNVAAVCVTEDIKTASDLQGYQLINYYKGTHRCKKELEIWIDKIAPVSNIRMLSREEIEKESLLEVRWKYAKEIIIVNFAATSFLTSTEIAGETVYRPEFTEIMKEKLKAGVNFKFLLTQPGSFADYDASKSKMNVIANADITPYDAITLAVNKLDELRKGLSEEMQTQVTYKLTDIALPYAAVLVDNDDAHKRYNNVKVDLYSPYLSNDKERRSFVLYPANLNYDFFVNNISQLWGHSYLNVKDMIYHASIKKSIDTYENKEATFAYHLKEYDEAVKVDKLYNCYSTIFINVIEGRAVFEVGGKSIELSSRGKDILIIPKQMEFSYEIECGTKILKIVSGNLFFRKGYEWISM